MAREFSRTIIGLFDHYKRAPAPEQGGLLSGKDPSRFDTNDPIRLWIIQVGIIVLTASLLSLGLRKIRQPKVIAEVLGGIILGPTAFGRIPGFTEHVFPNESRPYLSLVSTIGLCLFLFIVGLEIDVSIIKRNARLSASIALSGMVIPFGLGAALAVPLHDAFIKIGAPHADVQILGPSGHGVQFTHFMLFTGVAYSITAFPVLCRILTELKLLDTTVGIVVLSAGIGNDIIGWTLLALSVALVNAGSGLTALYILLTCVGWTVFMLIPVKIALHWLARKTGSLESGPTVFFMTVTMLIVFGSAFFTDIIGVHAIFGAFIAGLIVPRRGGLAIALTEKLEDMVAIIFLPLYFTLSGLSTNLGLLNDGVTWGYTIAIICLAFIGKFGGCILAARYLAGFNWRESGAIGSLMSCKGLVELIVLNVGLSAGILSQRVFSMFVLEALILTFMTTPLVMAFYPPQVRVRIAKNGANFNNVADDEADAQARENAGMEKGKARASTDTESGAHGPLGRVRKRFAIVLDKLEHLPGVMAVTQLIQPPPLVLDDNRGRKHQSSGKKKRTSRSLGSSCSHHGHAIKPTSYFHAIHISALRLMELTDRHSAVMKSSATDVLLQTDPLLAIYRTFVALLGLKPHGPADGLPVDGKGDRSSMGGKRSNDGHVELQDDNQPGSVPHLTDEGATVSPNLEIVMNDEMPLTVKDWAWREDADMVLIPWALHSTFGGAARSPANGSRFTMDNPQTRAVSGAATPTGATTPKVYSSPVMNPFEALFGGSSHAGTSSNNTSARHSTFVRGVFAHAGKTNDVGVYVDMNRFNTSSLGLGLGMGGKTPMHQHVFLPFVGGPDDRLALSLVVQLCMNPNVTATVMRVVKTEGPVGVGITTPQAAIVHGQAHGQSPMATRIDSGAKADETNILSVASVIPQDTIYGRFTTETRMQSETADNILWSQCTTEIPSNPQVAAALARIEFKELATPAPLRAVLQEAKTLIHSAALGAGVHPRQRYFGPLSPAMRRLIVVTGRSRRLAVESHHKELKGIVDEYLGRGSGNSGTAGGPTGLGHLGSGFSAVTAASGVGGSGGGSGIVAHPGMAGEVMRTVGEVGTAFVVSGVGAGVLVVQAAQENH